MNAWTHVLKSAAFHRRAHLGALLGAALTTAILTGALLVGDSVKATLRRIALQRLGHIHYAMDTGKRFFADSLADRVGLHLHAAAAPVLRIAGIALAPAAASSIGVQVLGVDEAFWKLGDGPRPPPLRDDEADLGSDLALALGLHAGDTVDIRMRRPGLMPEDAPLSSREESLFLRRAFRVRRLVPDSGLGRFSLRAEQTAALNAFVARRWLQQALDLPGRANLLVLGPVKESDVAAVEKAIDDTWHIDDAGVHVQEAPALGVIQVTSDRVFIDPAVGDAAAHAGPPPVGAISYLVSSISNSAAGLGTPYSFVTAIAPSSNSAVGPVPADMADDEILVSQWLADAIAASNGTHVALRYLRLQPSGGFLEENMMFRVRGILPMDTLARERALMPVFPGLSNVERCSDWDIGLPMDEARLADKANESYWERYRQTPKALVTLAAGQAMWGSRFGSLMALRYAYAAGREDALRAELTRRVPPAALGLRLQPLRRLALRAVDQAQDLGQLFLGTSIFLIVSALVLTALLFSFAMQQRSAEIGTLMAVGWTRGRIGRRLLAEGALLVFPGALLGAAAGAGYARWLVALLRGPWSAAIAFTSIELHVRAATVSLGLGFGLAASLAAMLLSLRWLTKHTVRDLISSDFSAGPAAGARTNAGGSLALPALLGAAAAAAVAWAGQPGVVNPSGPFFASGALLLAALLALVNAAFARLGTKGNAPERLADGESFSLWGMALRNSARRRWRSLTVVGLFASGLFVVLAVSSMDLAGNTPAEARDSGTGGFAYMAPSIIPVTDDLLDRRARGRLQLDRPPLNGMVFVPMKVRDGDDAGCLNLNRAQFPRLLGVDPAEFLRRGAFAAPGKPADFWKLLSHPPADGSIPALAGDQDTLMWGLQKRAHPLDGDALEYTDEQGRVLRIRLVGALPHRLTVFHGSVLIPLAAFEDRFPSESGCRLFLIDAPANLPGEALRILGERLGRFGLATASSSSILRRFAAVEETYLQVFFLLGALGLLLGTAGMGVVVLRNIAERRSELAALSALGFPRSTLRRLLWTEHALLLLLGLVCGGLAAWVAMLPGLRDSAAADSAPLVAGAVSVAGLASVWLAVWAGTRGHLLAGLRDE